MARQQLKPVQNATHNARWKVLKERFAAQTAQIIEGFYEGEASAITNTSVSRKPKKRQSRGKLYLDSVHDVHTVEVNWHKGGQGKILVVVLVMTTWLRVGVEGN